LLHKVDTACMASAISEKGEEERKTNKQNKNKKLKKVLVFYFKYVYCTPRVLLLTTVIGLPVDNGQFVIRSDLARHVVFTATRYACHFLCNKRQMYRRTFSLPHTVCQQLDPSCISTESFFLYERSRQLSKAAKAKSVVHNGAVVMTYKVLCPSVRPVFAMSPA